MTPQLKYTIPQLCGLDVTCVSAHLSTYYPLSMTRALGSFFKPSPTLSPRMFSTTRLRISDTAFRNHAVLCNSQKVDLFAEHLPQLPHVCLFITRPFPNAIQRITQINSSF